MEKNFLYLGEIIFMRFLDEKMLFVLLDLSLNNKLKIFIMRFSISDLIFFCLSMKLYLKIYFVTLLND